MSLGHSEVSFNHSCLKVPVDSLSRRPSPKYERLSSAKNSGVKKTDEERKEYPLSNLYNSFASVKSYLEFYESIPDYSELHHLSNEEFYSRLKSLKITQKRFISGSDVFNSVDDGGECFDELDSRGISKNNVKKSEGRSQICVCCCECSPDKDYCNGLNLYEKKENRKPVEGSIKAPPPKINIISDNENASDLFEFKKHSGYEADQESSTVQPGEKPSNKQKPATHVEDDFLFGSCNKMSRSLPLSSECECESPEFCSRFLETSFRNEGCCSRYGSGYCVSEKDRRSIIKTPKKTHSRPIPLTSRIPLFDKIMMEKEARRKLIHEQYSEELRSLVKPFSFTKREEEKERLRMISSNPELTSIKPHLVRFKAKPIPKNLFSNYAYERMREEEFYRALKRRIRAEELLKSSSLPPSMALREKMKMRSKSLDFLDYRSPKKSWNKACGYRRSCKNIKKEIEFDQKNNVTPQKKKLKSSRTSNIRRINSATDSSTEVSAYESILQRERSRKARPHSAFSCNRNNLASVLRIETARKRLEKEMEEKLRENRLKNEAKFKARLVRMTPAWRALSYDKGEDLALRVAARREEERVKKENHQRLMESIYGRVHCMPPLFHRERFPNGKKSKIKNSNSNKNSVNFSYNDTNKNLKTDELCQDIHQEEEQEGEENKKGASLILPAGQKENNRSQQSSEFTVSFSKGEKEKIYESDDTIS